jgi:hypothetical protein
MSIPDGLKAAIIGAIGQNSREEPFTGDPAIEVAKLRSRKESLEKVHEFKAGDIVQWKPGLKNRRIPMPGQPAIVLEYLGERGPMADHGVSSCYHDERLDLKVAILDEDGDFNIWHLPAVRFEPHPDFSND